MPGQVQYLTHLGDGTVDIKVHGYPSPVVTWRKNGFAIDHTAERYQILPGGSLRIRNVSLSDGGKYRPYFSQMGLGVNQGEVITVIVQGLSGLHIDCLTIDPVPFQREFVLRICALKL